MDRVIEIGGETIWDLGETAADREYFRLLQLSPWSEENARRLGEMQPLEDERYAKWKALLDQYCKDPNSVNWQQESVKAEDRGAWGCEWLALDSKWRRKTAEGRAAAEQEWETLQRCNFSSR